MTYKEKRIMFSKLICQQVLDMFGAGYEVSFGEIVRTRAQAEANADAGAGIRNSLHLDGLAADLNLYKDGAYLDKTESHRQFGELWKARHPYCRWGGDIKSRPDGNHYSFTDDNRI